mmetsp:Transcript_7143/g.16728  ORF Transcript_7143/g.16728 Transcript_7143/m.16728 type:complete len:1499 (+) Transcript_7143:71-4567(+)
MHVHGTEDGDAPAVLPRRVDQDQNHESVNSFSSGNNNGSLSGSPLPSPKQTPSVELTNSRSLPPPPSPDDSDQKPISVAESSVATETPVEAPRSEATNSIEKQQQQISIVDQDNVDGDEVPVAATTASLPIEHSPHSGMKTTDPTTPSDVEEVVDTNNIEDDADLVEEVCEDSSEEKGRNGAEDVPIDDSSESSTVESNAKENSQAPGEVNQEQAETKDEEEPDALPEARHSENEDEKDKGTVDANAVTEDDKEAEETQEEVNEEQESGKPEEGIPRDQQDEAPTSSAAVSDNKEDETDQPLEEATQEKEEPVPPPQDDAQEVPEEGTAASPPLETSQPEDSEINVEKPHEVEADEEEESNETPKELQTEEPVESEESTPLDPIGGAPGEEPSAAESTIANGDESSAQGEKEDDEATGVDPTASDANNVAEEGQETTEYDPDSSQQEESETTSKAPEEKLLATKTSMSSADSGPPTDSSSKDSSVSSTSRKIRVRRKHQQNKHGEKMSATKTSISSDSGPPTDASSKNSSVSSTSQTIRVRRKRGKSAASGGSGKGGGDEENGFDEGTNDETVVEGIKRPAYKGHSLHKPDHYRNSGGKAEDDEYTEAAASEDASGEQNLIPMPGAFVIGSDPSQDPLVETSESSDTEGSRMTGAETVTTAVLAQEYNEEELEENRLENDRLRREVSQMRRERDNVAVVLAVRPGEDGDDEQKDEGEDGSSTRKLQCLALFLLLIGGGVAAYFLLGPDESEPVTAAPTSDLPCVTFVSESPVSPLSECQGDCDSDFDCEDGLECFQRGDAFQGVPGCSCGEEDASRTDYCVRKKYPPLSESDQFPLGICQGDCDEDSDCGLGLICAERSSGEPVPGCSGGENDQSNTDYCIEGTREKPQEPLSLGLCEGQCEDDSSCKPGLFCYQRDVMGEVPGCTDIVENSSSDRFCVSGVYKVDEYDDRPMSLCRGDCDEDTDCEDGLFCFQRSSGDGQAVPGCIGGLEDNSNNDYCVRDIYREFTPFLRWGDQLVGLPRENFGASVSLSGDGQVLVVGAMDVEAAGYVDVYKATESDATRAVPTSSSSVIWTQMTRLVGETAGEAFGSKVALSSDGQTLVVGSVVDIPTNTSTRRAARIQVFQATATLGSTGADLSNWTSVDAEPSNGTIVEMIGDEYDIDGFDFSVAISNDGKYVVLGQPSNGGEKLDSIQRGPLVYRKDRQDNDTDVMTFLGAPFARLYTGSSVTITTSSDGNPRVAASGDNSVRGDGQVRVKELMTDYSNSTNQVPMQPVDETEGWFEVATNSIGQSDNTAVDLSTDGNLVALAITNRTSLVYNNTDGIETEVVSWNGPEHVIVYQFKKQGVDDYWDQIGNLISVPTSKVEHMPTVALSDDGLLLAVGEPWVNFNTGRVRIFKYAKRSNRWVPLQAPIVGRTRGELFGSTLSLVGSESGASETENFTLAIGGPSQVGRGLVECYYLMASMLLEPENNNAASNLQPESTSRIQEIAWDLVWSP